MRLIWNSSVLGAAYKHKDGKYVTLAVAQKMKYTTRPNSTKRIKNV